MYTPNISDQILNDLIFTENIHNKDLDQGQKAEFIKTLEAEIGKKWQYRVNNIKGRFVLFVGQDTKLLQALGSYYYLIKGKTRFFFYSLDGKIDDELKGIFYQVESFWTGNNKITDGNLLERLQQGCSVFLDCLGCKDSLFLGRLTGEIKTVQRNWPSNDSQWGMLIVSTTTSIDSIPEYFKRLFEVIELEPGKQSKAIDTEGTPKSEVVAYNWSIDDKQEVYSNGKFVARLSGLQLKLFDTLKRKAGKFVKRKTIEGCWNNKPNYESFVTDAINEMETILKKGLESKENVVDRKKNGKIITEYKLLP